MILHYFLKFLVPLASQASKLTINRFRIRFQHLVGVIQEENGATLALPFSLSLLGQDAENR